MATVIDTDSPLARDIKSGFSKNDTEVSETESNTSSEDLDDSLDSSDSLLEGADGPLEDADDSPEVSPEGENDKIPGFIGEQFPRDGTKAYNAANELYATTSHGKEHKMQPGLIVRPTGDEDVIAVIKYANETGRKLAIKTGGHQYSGACSTSGRNIMVDLGSTYQHFDLLKNNVVRVGVSHRLEILNAALKKHGLFVPHGQCSTVHVGGHGQTGGYGNLARSFGLFGDHILQIRLFTHDATAKEISLDSPEKSDQELFKAILGGSPGNFGIVTHYWIQTYHDSDFEFEENGQKFEPYYYRGMHLYTKDVLEKCLEKVAEMADNPNFERNYDLCISVLSATNMLGKFLGPNSPGPQAPDEMGVESNDDSDLTLPLDRMDASSPEEQKDIKEAKEQIKKGIWPKVIVIYAQYVPLKEAGKKSVACNRKWFDDLYNLRWRLPDGLFGNEIKQGTDHMSNITGKWIFNWRREFEKPYEKRTYLTTSTKLQKSGWPRKTAQRIHMIISPWAGHPFMFANCYLAVQIQPYGGNNSQFFAKRKNGLSYSWRDSTVVQVLDCFYNPTSLGKRCAMRWQQGNDAVMKGKKSYFGEQDRRVLWGSYQSKGENWDMKDNWKYYYETAKKYEDIGRVRGAADPWGTFTPNPFAVEAIPPPKRYPGRKD